MHGIRVSLFDLTMEVTVELGGGTLLGELI